MIALKHFKLKNNYFVYQSVILQILLVRRVILRTVESKISKYCFVKDEVGYTGNKAVNKTEVETKKKCLQTTRQKILIR